MQKIIDAMGSEYGENYRTISTAIRPTFEITDKPFLERIEVSDARASRPDLGYLIDVMILDPSGKVDIGFGRTIMSAKHSMRFNLSTKWPCSAEDFAGGLENLAAEIRVKILEWKGDNSA